MNSHFRTVPAIMYVDESGKVLPNFAEVNAVGAIAVPAVGSELHELTGLVGDLLQKRFGDRSSRKHKLVVHDLPDELVSKLADTIRTRHWYLAYDSLPPNTAEDDKAWNRIWNGMLDSIEHSKKKTHGSWEKARCDHLISVCSEMRVKHPLWTWFIFRVLSHMAKCFRNNGILPRIQVVIDEHGGHSAAQKEFLRFLTRFTFSTSFMEVYKDRLAFVLGVKLDGQFRCRTSSDDDDDGIHIANLVANASRRLRQGKDNDGRIQAFFDRCSVLKWQSLKNSDEP